jgi:hypothetical protein
MIVAELETLFTANITAYDKGAAKVEATNKALAKSDPTVKVDANATGALADMNKVIAEGRTIDKTTATAKIDADITKAEKNAGDARTLLAQLEKMDPTVQVTADIASAQASLARTETALKSLQGARATMLVDADTTGAQSALGKLPDAAGKAGDDAGATMSKGIVSALVAIPFAGAVIGIGAAVAGGIIGALRDGLQVEARSDLLTARTGLDPATVAKIARAAGESYADNFGLSIASGMDTARVALTSGLLNPTATARDTKAIIESLDGVATVIGEDIPAVSRSTAQLLRTGLAKDAAGAFDLIVKGSQAGLNVSGDWLDTVDEYSTQFRKLGLDGPQALGLLSQAIKGGARDTDIAADSLKEFAIRAVDGSKTTVAGFTGIGLSATDMAAAIAKGGPEASAALDLTLDRLRAVEDPTTRATLAVDLFGTKAEDMGAALYSMDLSNAVTQLGTVAGAAQTAVSAMGDNAASSIESAQRNIEVAADGIKGALATAFSPQIEGFATFVSENREAVMGFLLDLANGGIDAGRSLVNAAASGTEAFGAFVAGPAADLLDAVADIVVGMDHMLPGDQGGKAFRDWADGAVENMHGLKDASKDTADEIRKSLITDALDPAQAKLNGIALPMIAQAALHDASLRVAKSVDAIGYAADGSRLALSTFNGNIDVTTEAGKALDGQLRTMVESLDEEARKALLAGEGQAELTTRYAEGRQALVDQLVQMGFTADQAQVLADRYGAIPGNVSTIIEANTTPAATSVGQAQAMYDGLGRLVVTTTVDADTSSAYAKLATIQDQLRSITGNKTLRIAVGAGGQGGLTFADGGVANPAAFALAAGGTYRAERGTRGRARLVRLPMVVVK